jgi:hypothetical protein
MRSAWALAGYALVLAVPATLIWLFHSETIEPAMLSWGLVGWAALALLALTALGREPRERLLPDSSLSTVLLAIGAAMTLNGVVFGLWLELIGAEVILLGLIGLAGEWIAARRSRG